jgi:hypothetical protein
MAAGRRGGAAADGEICVANETQSEQFRVVFLRAVDADPARWNVPAIVLAASAYKAAWPCDHGGRRVHNDHLRLLSDRRRSPWRIDILFSLLFV